MILQKIREDYRILKKQYGWLAISHEECFSIGVKKEYTVEEFGKFETLCSRYSRSIDYLIRKMFRTIDAYEFENQGTLIDTVNHAHKRGLILDIEQLRVMKDVHNTLVHEYIEDALQDTFDEVLEYSVVLMEIMKRTQHYIEMNYLATEEASPPKKH
jgi:hypothetical protein